MKTNLTVVIPILEMGDKEKDLFANAIKSIEEQEQKVEKIVLVVPKDSEVKKSLKEFDFSEDIKDLVEIVENPGKTDYCSQINLGVEKVQTEWFSILEIDDVYSSIWFKNFIKYEKHYKDVDTFLPIVLDVNNENQFIHFSNEPVWAKDFSEKMGVLDFDSLLNFPNFQLSGAVIKTESFKSAGGLKGGIKMFFNYEFFLRMSYYDMKIMTIPKIGYKKINMRENSLFWNYKNSKELFLDPIESKFWYNTSKKECYFKKDRDIKYEFENVG
tara:strand:- start:6281 stop:7093 length:813 start_codon:yes stop_codon:yes gene_type:complete